MWRSFTHMVVVACASSAEEQPKEDALGLLSMSKLHVDVDHNFLLQVETQDAVQAEAVAQIEAMDASGTNNTQASANCGGSVHPVGGHTVWNENEYGCCKGKLWYGVGLENSYLDSSNSEVFWMNWDTSTGNFECKNTWFGVDPAPNKVKKCACGGTIVTSSTGGQEVDNACETYDSTGCRFPQRGYCDGTVYYKEYGAPQNPSRRRMTKAANGEYYCNHNSGGLFDGMGDPSSSYGGHRRRHAKHCKCLTDTNRRRAPIRRRAPPPPRRRAPPPTRRRAPPRRSFSATAADGAAAQKL